MPMEKLEFKRNGNTLTAYDGATGVVVDQGEYVDVTAHKQHRRYVDFKAYGYKKFELEDKLYVKADFLKRNLMDNVRYMNAPVLGCRTYFNVADVDQWLAENFIPHRRTIALCLSDLTKEQQAWVKDLAKRFNEQATQTNPNRAHLLALRFQRALRDEWTDYVTKQQSQGQLLMFQPIQNPDRTALYPAVPMKEPRITFKLDHSADIKPLPKGEMSEITMTRREYFVSGHAIEWKFGTGKRPKTLFEDEKLPDDAVWRLFSRKVRNVVSPLLFTTGYQYYLEHGGQRS